MLERPVIVVVDDIDAAHERHAPVDHRKLAVQPAQVAARQTEAAQDAVDAQLHAAVAQALREFRGHVAGAKAVDGQAHRHAAGHRADQRITHGAANVVVSVDIGFQYDLEGRRVNGGDQCGKEVPSAAEQAYPVAAHGLAVPPGQAQQAPARAARNRPGTVIPRRTMRHASAHSSRLVGVGYP